MKSKLFYTLVGGILATLFFVMAWTIRMDAPVQFEARTPELLQWLIHIDAIDPKPSPPAPVPKGKSTDIPKGPLQKKVITTGSGTPIGHILYKVDGKVSVRTIVLTVAHVVEGTDEVVVYLGEDSEKKFGGRIFARDNILDLALIEIDANLPVAKISFDTPRTFTRMWKIGYPFNKGATLTDGYMGPLVAQKENRLRQGSPSTWFGDSGGGLFVRCEETFCLTGVVDAIWVTPTAAGFVVADTVSFFVPMSKVEEFLIKNKVSF
ncbi:MAG: serine protease [Nitrososphaera sp.]|nr:serine protease [Nitrososphaera sp.]